MSPNKHVLLKRLKRKLMNLQLKRSKLKKVYIKLKPKNQIIPPIEPSIPHKINIPQEITKNISIFGLDLYQNDPSYPKTTSSIFNYIQNQLSNNISDYLFFQISNSEMEDLELIENNLIHSRNIIYPKDIILSFQPFDKNDDSFINKKQYKQQCIQLCSNIGLCYIEPENINNIHSIVYDLYLKSTKEITQIYHTSEKKTKKGFGFGFGDYVRGVAHLCHYLQNTNYIPQVSFSNHSLSEFFYSKKIVPIETCDNIIFYVNKILSKLSKHQKHIYMRKMFSHKYIFSHMYINHKLISPRIKQFVRKNCLTPRIHLQKKINELQQNLQLIDKQYYVIHARLHDNDVDDMKHTYQRFKNKIRNLYHQLKKQHPRKDIKILLLSNSQKFLDSVPFHFISKTNLSRGHTGSIKSSSQQILDTVLELMLMTKSKKIFQLSVYPWGSNFADIAKYYYDVPIQKIK